ncbi:MAG: serine/threonine protein kinase [Myxococcales bacterium]|nr:serine/threonine protein kinase [Myxococcales bacterium]
MDAPQRIGDWIVEAQIGAGGMGAVYRCRSTVVDRRAAVKWVSFAGVPEGKSRFKREVEALISLGRNQHIAQVYGFGLADDESAGWIAMELIEGPVVRGPLPEARVRALLEQIGGALHAAHEHRIAHRDVKPGNILHAPERGFVLVDFGIARTEGEQPLTDTGWVAGTIEYTPPEMWLREDDPDGALWDVYSLGQVAYELLVGEKATPTRSDSRNVAPLVKYKMRTGPLDPSGHCSPALAALVREATAPEPEARTSSMARLLQQLDEIRTDGTTAPVGTDVEAPAQEHSSEAPTSGAPRNSVSLQSTPTLGLTRRSVGGAGLGRTLLRIGALGTLIGLAIGVPTAGLLIGWMLTRPDGTESPVQVAEPEPPAALPAEPTVPPVEPAVTPAPTRPRRPTPTPSDEPAPPPAPSPRPAAQWVRAPAQQGVRIVALQRGGTRLGLDRPVPPGTYDIIAVFGEGKEVVAGDVSVGSAEVVLECNTGFELCGESP